MTAAIGFPTLRLVRVRIENLLVGKMSTGSVRELTNGEVKEIKKTSPKGGSIKN
jgi:23S rRNA pseudouridine2457 synthase